MSVSSSRQRELSRGEVKEGRSIDLTHTSQYLSGPAGSGGPLRDPIKMLS